MDVQPAYRVDPYDERKRHYKAGEYVIRQGDPNDQILYVLNKGQLGVFRENVQIAEISEPNVFFGEMSLLFNEPRTASIKTLSPCTVTAFEGGLDRLTQDRPLVALKLLASLARRLERTSRDHAEALKELHAVRGRIEGVAEELQEVAAKNEALAKQNEELTESIEVVQEILQRKQQEVDELTKKRGFFSKRGKK